MLENIVLVVRFVPHPGKRDAFRDHLFALVEAMAGEEDFVNTIVHDDLDAANELVLYEIWRGTREEWNERQPPKAYRKAYEAGLDDLLSDRTVTWLRPVAEWGSSLTGMA